MVYRITLIVLIIGKAQFRRAMLSCDSSCFVLYISKSCYYFLMLKSTLNIFFKEISFSLQFKSLKRLLSLHDLSFLLAQEIKQNSTLVIHMSRVMRKPTICVCENKDADQLRGNREADQHLCFRYIDSTIPLLSKSEISSL